MKITNFDPSYSSRLATGDTTLYVGSSGGSNGGFAGDVTGSYGSLSVVSLRNRVSLASNMGDSTLGTVLTTVQTSPWVAQFAVPSNSGASFGSNATRVSASSSVGASANSAREDHRHDGIGTITASSSNTLDRGTFNLRAGSNVSFALSDSDGSGGFDTVTVSATATGGGSGITIEEVDGSPTVAATKLVLPNGTLGVVGTVATYTPTGGGGGVAMVDSLIPVEALTGNSWMGYTFSAKETLAGANVGAYQAFGRAAFPMNGTQWTGWLSNGGSLPIWLRVQLPAALIATGYTVQPWYVDNFPGRTPKTWTFEGSNDGSSWTTLDTQTNITSWVQYYAQTFTFTNTTAYAYYQLNVSVNGGNAYVGVGAFRIFGTLKVSQ